MEFITHNLSLYNLYYVYNQGSNELNLQILRLIKQHDQTNCYIIYPIMIKN